MEVCASKAQIFKFYFLRKADGTEQTPFTKVLPSCTPFTAVWNKTILVKCLAQGQNLLM